MPGLQESLIKMQANMNRKLYDFETILYPVRQDQDEVMWHPFYPQISCISTGEDTGSLRPGEVDHADADLHQEPCHQADQCKKTWSHINLNLAQDTSKSRLEVEPLLSLLQTMADTSEQAGDFSYVRKKMHMEVRKKIADYKDI